MTAFNSSDIPADINTLEKLEVWAAHALTYILFCYSSQSFNFPLARVTKEGYRIPHK
jgi:hypothetical protein